MEYHICIYSIVYIDFIHLFLYKNAYELYYMYISLHCFSFLSTEYAFSLTQQYSKNI